MLHMTEVLGRMLHDTSGATAIEYAVVAAGVGGTVVGAVYRLGDQVKVFLWERVAAIFG